MLRSDQGQGPLESIPQRYGSRALNSLRRLARIAQRFDGGCAGFVSEVHRQHIYAF